MDLKINFKYLKNSYKKLSANVQSLIILIFISFKKKFLEISQSQVKKEKRAKSKFIVLSRVYYALRKKKHTKTY